MRLRATPKLVLAIGWLVLVVYAYPGQMTDQSFAMLRQARTRFYSDGYAPAISKLWSLLELVAAGPTAMLLVQSAMFVIGTYLILQQFLRTRQAAWATAALTVFPPIMVSLAVISPPSLLASFLVLGTGALLSDHRIAALAALFGATLVQPSALIATLPLVLVLRWRGEGRRILRALAAWAAIAIVAFGINVLLTHGHARLWSTERAIVDIAGTLAIDGDNDIRISVELPADGAAPPGAQRDELARKARAAVLAHPIAYLQHRLSVLGDLLWITDRHPEAAVPDRALPDTALKLGVPTRSSEVQDAATYVTRGLARHTPLFAPWLYFLLALVLLPFARKNRDVLALLASGIACEATLLVTATRVDYPQSLWLMISTCIAVIAITAQRARS